MTTLYNTTGQQVTVYATDGRIVWGGASNPTPDPVVPVTPPSGPAFNIATALSAGNNGATVAGGTTGTMVATDHALTVDVAEATFAWVSTYGYAYDQGATFRAAVTINGGPLIPVTVGGQATWRREKIANGEVATTTSDPITLNARAGSTMRVHMWAAADGPGQITADLIRQQLTDKVSHRRLGHCPLEPQGCVLARRVGVSARSRGGPHRQDLLASRRRPQSSRATGPT